MLTRVEFQFPQAPKIEKLTENEKKLLQYVEDIKKTVAEIFRTLNRPDVLAIDQATIDDSVIGGTTKAAGSFTTLTASGNTTLGDASSDTLDVGNGDLVKDANGNVGIGAAVVAVRTKVLDVTASGVNDGANISVRKKGTGIATLRLATVGDATGWDINYNFPATDDLGFHWLGTGSGTKLVLTSDGRLYGAALHNNAGAVTGTTNQYIASGTYTPTLTNSTNITSSSASVCQWLRVGNVVTVSGKATVEPTSTGTVTRLGISLPIASGIASSTELGGAGTYNGTNLRDVVCFAGDATNDRVEASFFPNATSSSDLPFSFTYLVK